MIRRFLRLLTQNKKDNRKFEELMNEMSSELDGSYASQSPETQEAQELAEKIKREITKRTSS